MSLRGIYDNGGVRKQNGHYQSSGTIEEEILFELTNLYVSDSGTMWVSWAQPDWNTYWETHSLPRDVTISLVQGRRYKYSVDITNINLSYLNASQWDLQFIPTMPGFFHHWIDQLGNTNNVPYVSKDTTDVTLYDSNNNSLATGTIVLNPDIPTSTEWYKQCFTGTTAAVTTPPSSIHFEFNFTMDQSVSFQYNPLYVYYTYLSLSLVGGLSDQEGFSFNTSVKLERV